jgi:hypothetical protein
MPFYRTVLKKQGLLESEPAFATGKSKSDGLNIFFIVPCLAEMIQFLLSSKRGGLSLPRHSSPGEEALSLLLWAQNLRILVLRFRCFF